MWVVQETCFLCYQVEWTVEVHVYVGVCGATCGMLAHRVHLQTQGPCKSKPQGLVSGQYAEPRVGCMHTHMVQLPASEGPGVHPGRFIGGMHAHMDAPV